MKRIRRWLSIARLIDLLLLTFVAIVVATAALDALLPISGHPVVIITGRSMAPSIALGSAVVEDSSMIGTLAPGDVASFRLESGAVVTHRIVRSAALPDGTWYETRGDANPSPDPVLLSSRAVLGQALFSVPFLGYLIWLLHLPSGILAVVSAALALYVAGLLAEADEGAESTTDTGAGGLRLPA